MHDGGFFELKNKSTFNLYLNNFRADETEGGMNMVKKIA